MKNIYLDHSVVGLIYEFERGNISGGLPDKHKHIDALKKILPRKYLVFYVSEDISSEVRKKQKNNRKLQEIIDRFKFISLQHRIEFGGGYRFGHGVTFGGPYPEIKNKIKQFLEERSSSEDKEEHEYDARELSNCYKNKIDYFVTIDYRTILKYKSDLKRVFGIKIVSPKELLIIITRDYI